MGQSRVALATAEQAAGLDEDEPLLLAALGERGVVAVPVVWDDPHADWACWDLVVVRSTWDYPRRHDAFVAWARHVGAADRLRNRADVIAWNSDKRYLPQLAAAGVPTVPSQVIAPHEPARLPDGGDVVVKPVISAGAQDTTRHRDPERAREHVERLHAEGRGALVQPYLERVDEYGETALVFLAGHFSHAIRKGPILRSAPVTVGGLFAREEIAVRTPTDAERDVAERALAALPFDRADLLYARVDLLPTESTPMVLEVELVEPSLFLRHHGPAAGALADAIAAELAAR